MTNPSAIMKGVNIMKKSIFAILLVVAATALTIVAVAAGATTEVTVPEVQILVKEQGEVVKTIEDNDVFFTNTYCTADGTDYVLDFSDEVYSFDYQLTAIRNDGSVYLEADEGIYRSNTHICRAINNAVNYLTVIVRNADGDKISQITATLVNQR